MGCQHLTGLMQKLPPDRPKEGPIAGLGIVVANIFSSIFWARSMARPKLLGFKTKSSIRMSGQSPLMKVLRATSLETLSKGANISMNLLRYSRTALSYYKPKNYSWSDPTWVNWNYFSTKSFISFHSMIGLFLCSH